jgi:hypothetical protein
MKPDWQNKSYAKSGSPAGPSTTHAKLKVGMSSLHSKISAANSNMPKAPKPAVRKFADGGSVRTRSDDEIGDTNPRTGVVDPGSYDRRMKAGEENLNRLNSAIDSIRSFFSREKSPETSSANITGDSGMSESDIAKKQAMSGGMDSEKKAEAPAPEEKRREITDYMVKKDATSDAVVQPTTTVSELPPVPAETPKATSSNRSVKAVKSSQSSDAKAETKNLLSRYPAPVTKSDASSFAEDVAKRKKKNSPMDISPTTMFSDTVKAPSAPPPEKKRIHPRTGKPY